MPELANPRHERFCLEYMKDMNASAAYVRCGYAPKNANVSACQLLANPNITARLSELRDAAFKKLHMSNDEIMAEAAKVGRFNMGSILHVTADGDPYVDLNKATPDHMAALSEATIEDFVDRRERDEEGNVIARDVRRVKVKAHPKLNALEFLAKIGGLLRERVEITVDTDFALAMDAARKRADER